MAKTGTHNNRRAPRRSPAEIAELLVSAGREIALSEGFGYGIEGLSFKKVLDRIEQVHGIKLAHASIIGRVFENQAEFQSTVLASLVEIVGVVELDEVTNAVLSVLANTDLTSVKSRTYANLEVIRLGALANEKVLKDSKLWPMWLSIVAADASKVNPDIHERLNVVLAKDTEDFTSLYQQIIDYLGFRIRSPYTLEHLTVAIGSLAEGAVIRGHVIPEHFERSAMEIDFGYGKKSWSLLGLAIKALSDQMLEIVPNFSPPASTAE